MLKELTECGNSIRKEMKVTLSAIKKNLQGTNNGRMKPRIKSTIWNTRKEIAFSQNNKGRYLAGVAQWIEHWPVNQRVLNSIPSQGTCLGCRPGPQ